MPVRKKKDQELTQLLTKLYTIQEDLGAKPPSTEDEKKQKACAVKSMGKGKKANKMSNKFLQLKSSIVERLQDVHKLLQEKADRESGKVGVAAGNNPKEVIAASQNMREQIREMSVEWEELNVLYRTEAKKRRSRFSEEELEVQETLVLRLQQEIETVTNAQQSNYAKGEDIVANLNTKALASLDAMQITNDSDGPQQPGAALTDGQQMQIQALEERDQGFDDQLDVIGEGIDDLAEIAQLQGEEVKRQGAMLDSLGNKIEGLNEKVENVNAKMKDTLAEVGRGSGKLCIDIVCILLALGTASTIYKYAKSSDYI